MHVYVVGCSDSFRSHWLSDVAAARDRHHGELVLESCVVSSLCVMIRYLLLVMSVRLSSNKLLGLAGSASPDADAM